METVWFDELDKKYKCKDCYLYNTYSECLAGSEDSICGDFMTIAEYESGVRLNRRHY